MSLFFVLFFSFLAEAKMKTESFIIQLNDQRINVLSPSEKLSNFSVILENRSLSNQTGKFMIGNKNLKFVTIKTGQSETVEIENKSNLLVHFVPLSPAFQEVPLQFGKKAYEIPSEK